MPTKPKRDFKGKASKTEKEIDFHTLSLFIGKWAKKGNCICLIEEVRHIHGASGMSTFKFGQNYQSCIDAVDAWMLPINFVPPKTWQKHFKSKNDSVRNAKDRALSYAKRIWANPLTQQRFFFQNDNGVRSRNVRLPHDGIVDALCIAYWGIRHIVERGRHPFGPVSVKQRAIFASEKENPSIGIRLNDGV